MDKQELKQMVAQLLREMEQTDSSVRTDHTDPCLPDITKEDQRQT